MKHGEVREVENWYDETLKFLEGEGMTGELPALGPRPTDYQNIFRTEPEKFLSKDNLFLLLKAT